MLSEKFIESKIEIVETFNEIVVMVLKCEESSVFEVPIDSVDPRVVNENIDIKLVFTEFCRNAPLL